ncbi:MAG TPA: hypothetical protein EYO31_09145 [Phycisphaerales bacterium]|nr:hypothetical protein [Phycisphaerales bacterium]
MSGRSSGAGSLTPTLFVWTTPCDRSASSLGESDAVTFMASGKVSRTELGMSSVTVAGSTVTSPLI